MRKTLKKKIPYFPFLRLDYISGIIQTFIANKRGLSLSKMTGAFCETCGTLITTRRMGAERKLIYWCQTCRKEINHTEKIDKEVKRRTSLPKKIKAKEPEDYDYVHLLCYSQPKLITLKKKPEIFEIALGGTKEEQLKLAKDLIGKRSTISNTK